jgi:hypothetical protein
VVTYRSKPAGSGIDIGRSQLPSAEQDSDEAVEMIQTVDDDALVDGLMELKDDDLMDDNYFEGGDDQNKIASDALPPRSPKRKPSRSEMRSEPVINLDDIFADEEIEDIIDFND